MPAIWTAARSSIQKAKDVSNILWIVGHLTCRAQLVVSCYGNKNTKRICKVDELSELCVQICKAGVINDAQVSCLSLTPRLIRDMGIVHFRTVINVWRRSRSGDLTD